ncbi:MerR family DNA-binding transcriptional regulator [Streptomyces sp. NPDC006990]|uniref:MerR family DNA-binding transcriptional regulator n=1 Tax=unclassified Streptomyces TaxID=2593676 RepID=UPI003454E043
MRIGEPADAVGVSSRSLRYHEEHGLIRSQRTPGERRGLDRELDTLQALRSETAVPHDAR